MTATITARITTTWTCLTEPTTNERKVNNHDHDF